MKNLVPALLISACATLVAPAIAEATCMNQCKAELIDSQCTAQTSVVQGAPLWFWLECQTCCAPPGGPVKCDTLDPHGLTYKVLKSDGSPAGGSLSPSALGCPGKTGYPLAYFGEGGAALEVGDYQLIQDSMILVEFSVVAKPVVPDASGDAKLDAAVDAADALEVGGGADAEADAPPAEVKDQDAADGSDGAELAGGDVDALDAGLDASDSDPAALDAGTGSPAAGASKEGCSTRPSGGDALPWLGSLLAGVALTRTWRRRLRQG